jgi:predicted ATP-grasp superfamily ATP-dependent carboligase
VDGRYEAPHFSSAWRSGCIGLENSPDEEAYVREIERICTRESIDVIFPSLDPEVYVFAKNKNRFHEQGVLCVVPDYDVLRIPANKELTIRAAARSGFPTPTTFLPKSVRELDQVIAQSKPPWVVKARYGAHRDSIRFIEDEAGLRDGFSEIGQIQPHPLVQEFVAGNDLQHYYVTVGRNSELLSVLSPETIRTYREGKHYAIKTVRSSSQAPYLDELRKLISDLGLWGGYTIQTKVDPLDGQPKLMEINARVGHHLWFRTELGVNEPLMLMQIADGKNVEPRSFPEGVLLLDPFHDLFYLTHCLAETVARTLGRPARLQHDSSIPKAIREIRADYCNRKSKAYGPEYRYLTDDPYPMLRKFYSELTARIRGRTPKWILRVVRSVRNRLSRPRAV